MFLPHFALIGLSILVIFVINVTAQTKPVWSTKQTPFQGAKRVSKTWTYQSAKAHGNVTYADPYVWMEDPIESNPDIQEFVNNQMQLTKSYLDKCTNFDQITQSIRNAYDYDDYDDMWLFDVDVKEPFYIYSTRGANDSLRTFHLASVPEMELAKKKEFLVEAMLSENSTSSLITWNISPDLKTFAYLVTEEGTDTGTWYFRKLDSPLVNPKTRPPGGEDRLPDVIPSCDGGIFWNENSSAFFYTQLNNPEGGRNTDIGSRVRHHIFGTSYEKDITVVHPDPDQNIFWGISGSEDFRWLYVTAIKDADMKSVAYATLLTGQTLSDTMKWISLSPSYDYTFNILSTKNDYLYIQTDKHALDGKVSKLKLDWSKARQVKKLSELKDQVKMTDIIPEKHFALLAQAWVVATDKIMLFYVMDGRVKMFYHHLHTGKLIQEVLPNESSTLYGIYSCDVKSNTMILALTSTTSPKKIYQLQLSEKTTEVSQLLLTQIKGTNPSDYVTEQLEATSKDGTKVPYFIVHRKGKKRDGTSPAIMHVYGFYGSLEDLYFDSSLFSWMTSYDGIIVWAGIRGGSERGQEWHLAGSRDNKPKTFDDAIAVAQDLIARKIAAPGKVIGHGYSGGGMTVAVAAHQAPQNVFGAMLCGYGVLDAFLLARSRIGGFQVSEIGDPKIPKDFDSIYAYSPLQNLSPKKQYPPILVTFGDSDERVVPGHGLKYIAQIQEMHPNSTTPLLMDLISAAAHREASTTTEQLVSMAANQHCFTQLSMGLTRQK
ncbi:uncharacterized protein FA14DRAFT_152244 [Meira miltonrushii]|uniref:Prolyl endopeptidase n=1 Tax=Meira miltonrushii TaxID=1280837 RepID=A0A316VGV1_9BASI|nr:uncharacterized protein FA14DRAFT_152244 [Meira miltonrushii]PWN36822.1 hypothetical protein FA14DRAFT_152244 [Meira miltonrushii]